MNHMTTRTNPSTPIVQRKPVEVDYELPDDFNCDIDFDAAIDDYIEQMTDEEDAKNQAAPYLEDRARDRAEVA